MDHAPLEPALALMPETDARAALGSRTLSMRMLLPPYPAIGLGTLRVLRVTERAGATELIVGYDGYERTGPRERSPGTR